MLSVFLNSFTGQIRVFVDSVLGILCDQPMGVDFFTEIRNEIEGDSRVLCISVKEDEELVGLMFIFEEKDGNLLELLFVLDPEEIRGVEGVVGRVWEGKEN